MTGPKTAQSELPVPLSFGRGRDPVFDSPSQILTFFSFDSVRGPAHNFRTSPDRGPASMTEQTDERTPRERATNPWWVLLSCSEAVPLCGIWALETVERRLGQRQELHNIHEEPQNTSLTRSGELWTMGTPVRGVARAVMCLNES